MTVSKLQLLGLAIAVIVLSAVTYNYSSVLSTVRSATTEITSQMTTQMTTQTAASTASEIDTGIAVTSSITSSQLSTTTTGQLVWSASFASGTEAEFNGTDVTTCGATSSVSSLQTHGSAFAGYYYDSGGPFTENCRAYPTEMLSLNPSSFVVQVWVYVPAVTLNDWVSFLTLHLTDGTFITVDSNTKQALHLFVQGVGDFYQASPIKWPFNTWFSIGVDADLQPGLQNASITVYQNDVPIINYTGYAGDGLLWQMHFGLYTGEGQGHFAVYNDDITVWSD